jgi:cytidylate kinase
MGHLSSLFLVVRRSTFRPLPFDRPEDTGRNLSMQIICVSKGAHGPGKELAESLAGKMGYVCLSRTDLVEAATEEGIQVGKLEMAMVRGRGFTQRLALERDHYLAFSRAYLCERALEESLVYHGRTGHLLLPGVRNIFKIRAVAGIEHRISRTMAELGLERQKATRYVRDVDEDRARWVRSMYGVAVDESVNYDITINLEQVGIQNAASALVASAQLPEFQMTPASVRVLEDLYLGAKARLALSRHPKTCNAAVKVTADRGVVTVSYLPKDGDLARLIGPVMEGVSGIEDLRITMASASLLWIQEEFSPESDVYEKVLEIATKWNAAVELVRLAPKEAQSSVSDSGASTTEVAPLVTSAGLQNGGIEDDDIEADSDDGGLSSTLDHLAQVGRAGGGRSVYGGQQHLLEALDRGFPYTLVVLGEAFLAKSHAARMRAVRDLRSFLSERIRAPVVTSDEIGIQYLFGRRDALRAAVFLGVTALLYYLVFTNQETVLAFLAQTGWYADEVQGTPLARFAWVPKALVALTLVLFIPLVAFSYGRVVRSLMKLIKME